MRLLLDLRGRPVVSACLSTTSSTPASFLYEIIDHLEDLEDRGTFTRLLPAGDVGLESLDQQWTITVNFVSAKKTYQRRTIKMPVDYTD